jgi:hypothetical protein
MFDMRKQMEDLGMPFPIPPKEYEQRYMEALTFVL